MKKLLISAAMMLAMMTANAENLKVTSPDGRLSVNLTDEGGIVTYAVTYDGQEVIKPSQLGFVSNVGDFSKGLTFKKSKTHEVNDRYNIRNIKAGNVEYHANELNATYADSKKREMTITVRVSDNKHRFPLLHASVGRNGKYHRKERGYIILSFRLDHLLFMSTVKPDGGMDENKTEL